MDNEQKTQPPSFRTSISTSCCPIRLSKFSRNALDRIFDFDGN